MVVMRVPPSNAVTASATPRRRSLPGARGRSSRGHRPRTPGVGPNIYSSSATSASSVSCSHGTQGSPRDGHAARGLLCWRRAQRAPAQRTRLAGRSTHRNRRRPPAPNLEARRAEQQRVQIQNRLVALRARRPQRLEPGIRAWRASSPRTLQHRKVRIDAGGRRHHALSVRGEDARRQLRRAATIDELEQPMKIDPVRSCQPSREGCREPGADQPPRAPPLLLRAIVESSAVDAHAQLATKSASPYE